MDRLPKYVCVKMEKPLELEEPFEDLLEEYFPKYSSDTECTETDIEECSENEIETIEILDSEDEIKENEIRRNKDLTCHICDKIFTRKSHVTRHLEIHYRISTKIEKPEIEENSTSFNDLLEEHFPKYFSEQEQDIHTELDIIEISDSEDESTVPETKNNNKDLNCPVCDKTFVRKKSIKRHVIEIHFKRQRKFKTKKPDQKPKPVVKVNEFVCPTCSKSFKRNDHMIRHLQFVHKNKKLKFENVKCEEKQKVTTPPKENIMCPFCNNFFLNKSVLRRHIINHCNKVGCNLCQQKFYSKKNMLIHRKRKHGKASTSSRQSRVSCTICKKKIIKKNLKYHMKLHSDEKPFKCPLCEYSANRNDYVSRHYKSAHQKI